MKGAFYIRVSTDRQNVDNQLLQLQAEADRRGLEIVKTYQEHESAYQKNRTQWQLKAALIDAREHKFDCLMVAAMDRLTRKGIMSVLQITSDFNAQGVTVISLRENFVESGEHRELFLAITGWAAKYESDIRVQRINAGLDRARKEGKILGRRRGSKDGKDVKRSKAGYCARWDHERQKRQVNNHIENLTVPAG